MLVSPANVNEVCPKVVDVALVALVELPAPAAAAGRSSIQGTGTIFPALERVEALEAALVEDVAPVVEVVPVPVELTESTAKSTRPEAGLKIRSLMVPMSWP